MDGPTFRTRVESAMESELAELGSSALISALTAGDGDDAESLLRAAAHSERAARETFREWVTDESDPGARAAFEAVAEQEADHFRRVKRALDGEVRGSGPGPMHAYLRGRSDTVERIAAGMVGRPLVSVQTHDRLITFFDANGLSAEADLFRELAAETEAGIDDGLELLAARCDGDGWERARLVAEYVIRVAHDDMLDALDAP